MQKNFGIRELAEWAKRDGALNLTQGTIEAAPPPVLQKAYRELDLAEVSNYNNKRGVGAYREAVQHYLNERGWKTELGQITGTAGAMGATVGALLTECRPGDTVLLPEPFFIGHKLMLEALGFRVIYIKTALDAAPNWHKIEEAMEEASALLLTTPANPTGQVASPETLKELAETAVRTDCLLLVDEVYRAFKWGEEETDDSEYIKLDLGKTVVMRSFSKSLAIPGWRVGFAVTTYDRTEKMATRHDALYIGGSTIAQNALAEALQNNLEELNRYIEELRQTLLGNRRMLVEAFAQAGMEALPTPAGNYLLLKHNRAGDIAAMKELMAKKLALVPVNILYADSKKSTGYLRAHFGVSRQTAEAAAERLVA